LSIGQCHASAGSSPASFRGVPGSVRWGGAVVTATVGYVLLALSVILFVSYPGDGQWACSIPRWYSGTVCTPEPHCAVLLRRTQRRQRRGAASRCQEAPSLACPTHTRCFSDSVHGLPVKNRHYPAYTEGVVLSLPCMEVHSVTILARKNNLSRLPWSSPPPILPLPHFTFSIHRIFKRCLIWDPH